jgi:hypothetical protein
MGPTDTRQPMVDMFRQPLICDCSDEVAVNTSVENPYWQYLTGETYFQTEAPIDPSSLTVDTTVMPKAIAHPTDSRFFSHLASALFAALNLPVNSMALD